MSDKALTHDSIFRYHGCQDIPVAIFRPVFYRCKLAYFDQWQPEFQKKKINFFPIIINCLVLFASISIHVASEIYGLNCVLFVFLLVK